MLLDSIPLITTQQQNRIKAFYLAMHFSDCIPIIEGVIYVVYTTLAALLIYYYAVHLRRWRRFLGKALLLAAMTIPPLAHMSNWAAAEAEQNAPEVEEMGERHRWRSSSIGNRYYAALGTLLSTQQALEGYLLPICHTLFASSCSLCCIFLRDF